MISIFKYLAKLADKEHYTVKILQTVIFVFLVALLFPRGKSAPQEYEIGAVWTEDEFIAPLSFPIYKSDDEYSDECNKALENVYDIYTLNPRILEKSLFDFEDFFKLNNNFKSKLSSDEAKLLTRISQKTLKDEIKFVLQKIYSIGLTAGGIDSTKSIILRGGLNEELVHASNYFSISDVDGNLDLLFSKYFNQSSELRKIEIKIAKLFIEPNILFQKDATETERKNAIANIPITKGAISKGESIVSPGDLITKDIFLKLKAFEKINYEQSDNLKKGISLLGKFLFVLMFVLLYAVYLFFFERKIFLNNSHLLLIFLTILFNCLIAYLFITFELPKTYRALIPIPLVGLLLTILFNSYIGFLSSVFASFLVSGIYGNDYSFLLLMLIGSAIAVISVNDVMERTQIFRSMLFIFISFAIYLSIHSLMITSEFSVAGISLLLSGLNAVFSTLLTYIIVLMLEKYFSYSTNFALIKIDNINHPLLKKLSSVAPGTYNHSLTMSNLANSAAMNIGANPLLAKLGALFHDIGKISNPNAFNENNYKAKKNKVKQNPFLQMKTIKKHVYDGIAIAKKEKLPNSILDFIPMHHGTRMVANFYFEAIEIKNGDQKFDKNDFRYPGPRPNTKETAIVMLADAVEASTRALKNPTIKTIEANIDRIIEERLREGELDDAPLTVRDLAKIKSSFLKILIGYHHTRIISPSKL